MTWFTESDLQRLAGPRSYERGRGYLSAIGSLDELPGGVVATVHGNETYRVRLFDHEGELDGECSCPYGQDGAFCKHCVAVGLALLAGEPLEVRPKQRRKTNRKVDIRAYLSSADPGELIDLLMELAAQDPAVHRKLSLRAATSGEIDMTELRRLVDTLRGRGFIDYAGSLDYATKAGDVIAALDKIATTHPGEAGPLYRKAIQLITATSVEADDSSGAIGDVASRAVDGYAAVCLVAPPDPVDLAHWIIDFQLDGPGWPEVHIGAFADALGRAGLTAYRAHLAKLHTAISASTTNRFDHRRFMVTHLREAYLKTVEGDTDALVALYAEELPAAYQYVRIGETLRAAGRDTEAIDWLERGLVEADQADRRIDSLLAKLYSAAGRQADALTRRWAIFTSTPSTSTHRELLDTAECAGALAETSDRALDHLRQPAERGGYHADPLITILLDLGHIDAAWTAATRYEPSDGTMRAVAERRALTHPADAIPTYQTWVARAIERKNKSGYLDAAQRLHLLKDLYRRTGQDFTAYLTELKAIHHRKRTFIAELTRANL